MTRLKKILVPVDFSEPSAKAIDYGVALALKFDSRLVLAHVVSSPAALNFAFPTDTFELEKKAFEDAKSRLPQLIPAQNATELDTQTIVKGGDVRQELLGIVDEEKIDLVVMGTHGRGTLGHLLLGSTTESILRRVHVPILTVSHLSPAHEAHGRSVSIRRILYATDLSENMRTGLRYSAELARAFGAELAVLNVVVEGSNFHNTGVPARILSRDNALIRLKWAVNEEHMKDVRTQLIVLEGEPHSSIIQFAVNHEVDLIVLNLHSKTFLERAVLGSTAERVIRAATLPVLSLPLSTAERVIAPAVAYANP